MTLDNSGINRKNRAIERLQAINFYQPERSLEEANSLISVVNKSIEDLLRALRPWGEYRLMADIWEAVYREIGINGMLNDYSKAVEDGREVTLGSAYTVEDGTSWWPRKDLGDYAALELIRNIQGFNYNIMEPFIRLYEIGLKPLDFRFVDDKEKFVVDFPLNINGKRMLGCYVYGDEGILWLHPWGIEQHIGTTGMLKLTPVREGLKRREFSFYYHPAL